MKPIIPFALLGALLAVGAADAAATDPVGYITLGDPTGPSIKANTDVSASIPLLRAPLFAGTVASVSGSEITITGAAFTASPAAGSFAPSSGKPYLIQIGNGGSNAKAGLIALITSNTATAVTVSVQAGDSLAGIVSGDPITIRESWTVANLFESNPVPAGTQVLGFSGAVPGINLAADLIYEFDGTGWVDTNSFSSADNVAIFPNESFVIRNASASPITSLVITGEVNTSNSRTVLPASGVTQDIAFSFFGSVGEVIGTSGLGAISTAGDQILLSDNSLAGQNKAASTIIEFDGSAWIDTNSFEDVSATFKFEPGVGYFLRAAASGDRVHSNLPDYVPGL